MSKVYEYKDYDKYLSRKCSSGVWPSILYFMHPYILLISTRRMGRGGGSSAGLSVLKNMVYPDNFSLTLGILATLPAICFLYAWIRKRPESSSIVKYIWRNGAHVLSLSAVLNIVVVFVPLVVGMNRTLGQVAWVQIGLSIWIIVYLQFSKRVKDTFADFPKEPVEK